MERDGEAIATGRTEYVLLDRASGKPRSVPEDIAALYLGPKNDKTL